MCFQNTTDIDSLNPVGHVILTAAKDFFVSEALNELYLGDTDALDIFRCGVHEGV